MATSGPDDSTINERLGMMLTSCIFEYMFVKRQSERELPQGAIRNGIIDGTKCQSEVRKANLFLLLCVANTTEGSMKLQTALNHNSSKWKKLQEFIKLYLSMCEWFHDCNDKEEVNQARSLIAKVLKMLQRLYPREEKQGWNTTEFHVVGILEVTSPPPINN
jgi:hypothetical protein